MREEEREAKYDDGECTQEHICGWNKTEVDFTLVAKFKSATKYGSSKIFNVLKFVLKVPRKKQLTDLPEQETSRIYRDLCG